MEKFLRKPVQYKQDKIQIQALEWLEFNEAENEPDDQDDEQEPDFYNSTENNKYIIRCFGVTESGNSVCINITDFTPFFYIKVPDNWTKTDANLFLDNLTDVTGYYNSRPYKALYKWGKYLLKDKCLLQKKKDFYGFSNGKNFNFLRLTFSNSDAMRRTIYVIKNHNDPTNKVRIENVKFIIKLYETGLDSILRVIHIRSLKPSGWIEARDIVVSTASATKKSTCQIEVTTAWTNIFPVDNNDKPAPVLQASFDIETYSVDGSFPSPNVIGNSVFQIATAFKYFGQAKFHMKHVICLKTCADITSDDPEVPVFVESYDTEREVLLAWKELLVKTDPDILYTYNGDGFDCNYLYVRSQKMDCEEGFLLLGKLKESPGKVLDKTFSSSAYGTSNYKRLSIPGRINFDILIYIQREYKENSYKLDSIAEKYLGQNKNPVTPQMMFDYFASGDPEKIKIVAEYCIQDTLLPQLLVDKMYILQNQISMSNVTYVPIKYLVERGQQIKVYSQILKETRKLNFLVPAIDRYNNGTDNTEEESFTGATVLPPKSGAYFSPITVADFASLYPSIIRAHNLCFSTVVLDEEKYGNIPDVDYKVVEWEDKDEKTGVITKHAYRFVQSTTGILPHLLSDLTKSRKDYKKLMAEAKDPFAKEIYNKCQLAVKVSMNSVYGFLAAPMLQCKPIAATVTAIGRDMIKDTKKFMEENYNAACAVYGDSVVGDTPLLLRNVTTGEISIKMINSICEEFEWCPYSEFKAGETNRRNKEQASAKGYQTWSNSGWTDIKRVIRHKTKKQIYRICTSEGIVEVTEDHSLLDVKMQQVKPSKCSIGQQLLQSYPEIHTPFVNIDLHSDTASGSSLSTTSDSDESYDEIFIEQAYIFGVFLGNGLCYTVGSDHRWGIVSENVEMITKTKEYIEHVEPAVSFNIKTIYNHYTLFPENNIEYISDKYRNFLYDENRTLCIPEKVLNNDYDYRNSFYNGLIESSFNISLQPDRLSNPLFKIKGKLEASKLYYLLKSINFGEIDIYCGAPWKEYMGEFVFYVSKGKPDTPGNAIDKIINLGYCSTEIFVYDLETEDGTFLAGIGSIIVKNTDSVFIKFQTKSVKRYEQEYDRIYAQTVVTDRDKEYLCGLRSRCISESIEMGKEAAQAATKSLFKDPINLEYEKVYCPLLLLSKKRYIGRLYSSNPDVPDKLDNKGVVLKRRDNFELLKTTYQTMIDIFLEEGKNGLDKVVEYINKIIKNLINDQIDIDTVIIAKALRGNYKNPNIPHVVLAKKLAERDPGNAPKSNDRIPYVFIDNGWKKIVPQYTKVEDPDYVKEHGLPLDKEYYVKFLMNPVCEILELFMDNPEKIFKEPIAAYKKLRKEQQKKIENEKCSPFI
jgi:DNA polymerase elongation subunit (family B)